MKKSVFFIALLVFVIACQPSNDKKPVASTFRSGSEGLFLSFEPNQPPFRVYDGEELDVILRVENRGAADVGGPGDKVYISGFDHNIIANILKGGELIPKVEGRSSTRLVSMTDFQGLVRPLPVERYPFNLLATACYSYETKAETSVCVDPDPFSPSVRQKVCAPRSIGLGTQGAPVAVSNVQVDARRGTTTFTLTINNVGAGTPFRFGGNYLVQCSPYSAGLRFEDVDYVMVADVKLCIKSIKNTCRPLDRNHVRLVNGRATIFCTADTKTFDSSGVVVPLQVHLKYGYRTTIQKNIEILRTPR